MNVRIYEFKRDWPFMNECGMSENVDFDMSLETGLLEGYTCAPPLDTQTFSSYRTNHAFLKG